jgi:hypothetical protein
MYDVALTLMIHFHNNTTFRKKHKSSDLVSSSGSTPVPTASSLLVKDKWVTDYIQGGSVRELHSKSISWHICFPLPSLPVLLPPNPTWSSQSDEEKNTEFFWYERVNVIPPKWFFYNFLFGTILNYLFLQLSIWITRKKNLLPSWHGLSITVSTVTSF